MTCTDSYETRAEYEKRIDSLLREMVVEEALGSIQDKRDPRSFTLHEIAGFLGIGFETVRRIESEALSKFKNVMINLEE